MEPLTLVFIAFAAMLVGLLLGWWAGGRNARNGAETVASMRLGLEGITAERDEARLELREAQTKLAERERSFAEQIAALTDAKEALSAQFGQISQELLHKAQETFLKRADERFRESEATSGQHLSKLLQPVHDRLERYERQVEKVEKERGEAFGKLDGVIAEMRAGQDRVQAEAARLVNSLRNAPKARGRWGEQQLKNVLESCGLSEHVDFHTEHHIATEDGVLRPDAILRVPGDRILVIDAKVSLNDYQDGFNAIDDDARALAMARHCQSMRSHIEGLSKKAYWTQFDNAPDYVIMFVPGEHFLAAALEHEPGLWDLAFERKVLLATPTNLVAIARTVAGVWRQEGLAKEAQQIGLLGKEMYDRLSVAAQHLRQMGSGLSSAVNNYNKFVGSFERNVMSTGRRFAELNIETGSRQLGEIGSVEALPRYGDEAISEERPVKLVESPRADDAA